MLDERAQPGLAAFPVFPPIDPEKAPEYLKQGTRSYHGPKFPPMEGGGLIGQSEK